MDANYFFIDGSALKAQIRQLQRAKPIYRGRKLCAREFIGHFMVSLRDLHGGSYKRATFYFPSGDEAAVEEYISLPNHRRPGEVRDIQFRFCGHKLKKFVDLNKFVEEQVPTKWHDRFAKSEKIIDIEMCCEALRLASTARLERLFLLTNDGDFIPLCRTLRDFGANISIIRLSDVTLPNADLLREADSYDLVAADFLDRMFVPIPGMMTVEQNPTEVDGSKRANDGGPADANEPESEKPVAEPSDLQIDQDPKDAEREQ